MNLADRIRTAIFEGDLAPGQRLIEADLCAQLGASRSHVRNALAGLVSEGLVERIPHRGARVRAITLDEAVEFTEIRMVVEGLCAAKAAAAATGDDARRLRSIGDRMRRHLAAGDLLEYSARNRELHSLIQAISGQSAAGDIIERIRGHLARHQVRLALRPGRAAVSLPQHLAIIEAICDHDEDRAESAMRDHLRSVIEALRSAG
ncbi:DNA-binding transcriptional regulator, GntR family [Nonomuraea solani]|uniref:DNA-binding transcriptional regulator, GntR family n=1 Tax=Nonomuraea solani TaxID=1144553 RepID=A0A1H5VX40_9ACTN|nr:GntR family transcriptional regulator [Nonomuraea solani]SEF91546.1 DNA-binding transcriptional regulator, GntR family [Nonomuraea solani]